LDWVSFPITVYVFYSFWNMVGIRYTVLTGTGGGRHDPTCWRTAYGRFGLYCWTNSPRNGVGDYTPTGDSEQAFHAVDYHNVSLPP